MTSIQFCIWFFLYLFKGKSTATSATSDICNFTYFLEGNPQVSTWFVYELSYASLINQNTYENSNSSKLQLMVFMASPLVASELVTSPLADGNPHLVLIDFYTRKEFATIDSYDAFDMLVLPNSTITVLTNNSKAFYNLGKSPVLIGSTFANSIQSFVYSQSLNRYYVVDKVTRNLYDLYDNSENFSQIELQMLNSYPETSYTKIVFDDIHQDLYLALGNDVLVYDAIKKRFWFRFTGHTNQIFDIKVISSKIPDKFCIISIAYNGTNNETDLKRWQPNWFYKNGTSMYNESQNYLQQYFFYGSINSIATAYRKEFLLFSFTYNHTCDIIVILLTDFSFTQFFYVSNITGHNMVAGDVEDTDIFFVYTSNNAASFVQYSLLSEFPNCAKCQSQINFWFYSYMRGCSNICDSFNRENFPFCEPTCDSQTCFGWCDGNDQCQYCDSNDYSPVTRFYIQIECQPKLNCIAADNYLVSFGNCQLCDSSCFSCVGGGSNQCLSCNGAYYYPAETKCEACPRSLIFNNMYCLPDLYTCPYGLFTNINETNTSMICNSNCSSICESCYGSANNCTSCAYELIMFNNTCVSQCPQGYYYGLSNATSGVYKKTCLNCNTDCSSCNLTCQLYNCQLPNCQNCTMSNTCQTCIADYYLYNGSCMSDCPNGYTMNSNTSTCDESLCSLNCLSCINSTFCLGCNRSFFLSNNVCVACNSSCVDCNGNVNNCTSCSIAGQALFYNETTHSSSCVFQCPIQYFNETRMIPYNCSICPQFCDVCNNASTCIKCATGYNYNLGSCIIECPLDLLANGTTCSNCTMGCLVCNSTNCTYCAYPFSLQEGLCVSDCGENYRKEAILFYSTYAGFICIMCPNNCESCDNNNNCTMCSSTNDFIDELGHCISSCNAKNYFISPNYAGEISTVNYCKNCSSSCSSCSQNLMNCTSCPSTQYLSKNTNADLSISYSCVNECFVGYYITNGANGNLCLQCDQNCLNCSSTVCSTCASGYYLGPDNECVNQCPSYYLPNIDNICTSCNSNELIYPFSNGSFACVNNCTSSGVFNYTDPNNQKNFCQNCTYNCDQCLNGNGCINCSVGYTKNVSTQQCDYFCFDGYYFKDNNCLPCETDMNCATCVNTAEQCTSCLDNYFLSFLNSSSVCLQCDANCANCEYSSTNCTSCPSGKFLINNTCKEKICPVNCSNCSIADMTQCTACIFDYSLINNSCIIKICPANCSNCSDSNFSICTLCLSGFMLFNNECFAQCPSNTYESDDNLSCKTCSNPQCNICTNNDLCLQCSQNYVLSSNLCVSSCESYKYLNETSNECLNCSEECTTCFGPDPNNCLSCTSPWTLKGTVCKSPCVSDVECLLPPPQIYKVNLIKSTYVPNQFYIVFNYDIDIPDYVNLTGLVNISIDGVNSSSYSYTVQKVDGQQNMLMVKMITMSSVKNPIVHVNFTEDSTNYIRGNYNTTVVTSNNSSNITLDSILVSSESKQTQEIKQNITYGTFVSFSYILLSFCVITYLFDTKRLSFYWNFTDFMQVTALMIFLKMNYDERFINYLELLFVYHADFLAFLGKNVNETTGIVSYFGNLITNTISDDDLGAVFTRFLGTQLFIANGFNAIFIIFALNLFILFMKYYLQLHKKMFDSQDNSGFHGILQYFYDYILFSVLIRAVQFFFYLIMTSVLIQFYSMDLSNDYNKYGIIIASLALIYYLCFFSWLSTKVINHKDIYESEEERWKYDCVFHYIETKTFFQRNHFNFVHIKKFLIVIGLASILEDMNLLLGYLLFIQICASLRYVKLRPFKSLRINLLNFLTEIAFLVIICILLKVSQVTSDQQNGDNIISDESINSIIQAGDAIISFTFIVLVIYSIVSGLLLLYYIVKNIDCICFIFFHQKIPEEEQTIIESFEEQRGKESGIIKDDSNKFKIPKKKNLREIAEQEEQWQKDLEAYKKEHIVKVG